MLAPQALPGLRTAGFRQLSASSANRPVLLSTHSRTKAKLQPLLRRHFASTNPTMSLKSYLVTPSELSAALETSLPTNTLDPSSESRIVPLCAAWFLPNDPEKRTGHDSFLSSRIPHARFFDLDAVKDPDSPYPHMLPTAEKFASAMSELGIRRADRVVVYDTAELGLFSAPRVAWTLRVFGHERVHVLNNFRLWKAGGYPIETGPAEAEGAIEPTKYAVPTFCSDRVIAFREVKDIARRRLRGKEEETQVIDVRSRGRFEGSGLEPRPGLSSGHMPGSINIPLPEMLDSATGALLPAEKLRAVFESRGLDPSKPIVSTCGTGVMAAACNLALNLADFGRDDERRVYDGSWTEYASRVKEEEGLIVKSD